MNNDRLLHIYLADHLTVASGTYWLARRCLSANRGTPLGDWLRDSLLLELEADVAALENVMDSIGAPRSRFKQIAARVAVQSGRLKLNGRMISYSPLSRLEELEALRLGVEAKALMWTTLKSLTATDVQRIRGVDLDALVDRAARQRAEVERHRLEAARTLSTA
jgi:hypothetical protein